MNPFAIEPKEVEIGFYQLHNKIRKSVRLINTSSGKQRLHVIPPKKNPYFSVSYIKKGAIAPGVEEDIIIDFIPKKWQAYETEITVMTATHQFVIPINAYPSSEFEQQRTKKNIWPKNIDFGKCALRQTYTKQITLAFGLPIAYRFKLEYGHPRQKYFNVEPMEGEIPANGKVKIILTYKPYSAGTIFQDVYLHIPNKPHFETLSCQLVGSTLPPEQPHPEPVETKTKRNPGNFLKDLKHQIDIENTIRKKINSTQTAKTKRRRSIAAQKKGLPIGEDDEDVPTKLSDKERKLLNVAAEFAEHEKSKEIKWFREVGNEPPTEDECKAISSNRESIALTNARYKRHQARQRGNSEILEKPMVPVDLKNQFLEVAQSRAEKWDINEPETVEPIIEELQEVEPPKTKGKGKPKGKKIIQEPVVEETTETDTPDEKVAKGEDDAKKVIQSLTMDFKRFAQMLLIRNRVKRRLQFVEMKTEAKNIQLSLAEAGIPLMSDAPMVFKEIPYESRDQLEPYAPANYPTPVFYDLTLLKPKPSVYYKVSNYEHEPLKAYQSYMPKCQSVDHSTELNKPLPHPDPQTSNAPNSSKLFSNLFDQFSTFALYAPDLDKKLFSKDLTNGFWYHNKMPNSTKNQGSTSHQLAIDSLMQATKDSNSDSTQEGFKVFTTFSSQFDASTTESDALKTKISQKHSMTRRTFKPALHGESDNIKITTIATLPFEIQSENDSQKPISDKAASLSEIYHTYGVDEYYTHLKDFYAQELVDEKPSKGKGKSKQVEEPEEEKEPKPEFLPDDSTIVGIMNQLTTSIHQDVNQLSTPSS